ncbi:MAG: hypothetical protein AVDCRST_MAG11-3979, partial [uncultured Gemmatimonadaceae bacterium]
GASPLRRRGRAAVRGQRQGRQLRRRRQTRRDL